MNRFEDHIRESFEHFEPEVDPGMWQQISSRIPSGTDVLKTGSQSNLISQLAVKLGYKGLVALIAAATMAGVVLYVSLSNTDEKKTGNSDLKSIEISNSPSAGENLNTPEATSANSEDFYDRHFSSADSKTANSNQSANQITESAPGQTALTGAIHPETGGSERISPASGSSDNTAISTEAAVTRHYATPASPSPIETAGTKEVRPTLILSCRKGFAPITVTAMTTLVNTKADFDFGDGISQNGTASAYHTYTEPGVYTIRCLVNGYELRETIEITGRIPSAFSPNGDGINDIFTIENPENQSIEIVIFSRSGELLFRSRGNNAGWDGHNLKGVPAPEGTYLYDIFAPLSGEGSQHQKGTIQLFR